MDSRSILKPLDPATDIQLDYQADWEMCDTSCCDELSLAKKDQMLLQQLFGHCASADIFAAFREMAEKHLKQDLEGKKQQWLERALEEIVDLLRGEMQPQEDVNLLRSLIDEREECK